MSLVLPLPPRSPSSTLGFSLGHILVWSGHLDRARSLLESLYRDWSERDERMAAYALWYLALVEFFVRPSLAGRRVRGAVKGAQLPVRARRGGVPADALPAGPRRAPPGRARDAPASSTERICRLAELHAAPAAAPDGDARGRRAVERGSRSSDRAIRGGGGIARRGRHGRADHVLVASRADRGAARARARRRRGRIASTPGRRTHVGSAATGCSRTRPGAAGWSPRRAATSSSSLSLLGEAVARHEAVGDPFGRARALLALGRRATAGAAEAAGPRGDRGGAGRLRGDGRRRLGRAGEAGARADRRTHAQRRSHTGGAARGRPRGEGTNERGGRRGALPRRAHRCEPSDPRVREAWRALADRARPQAAAEKPDVRRSKVQTF